MSMAESQKSPDFHPPLARGSSRTICKYHAPYCMLPSPARAGIITFVLYALRADEVNLPSPARAGIITSAHRARQFRFRLPSPARAGNITSSPRWREAGWRSSIPRSRGEHHQRTPTQPKRSSIFHPPLARGTSHPDGALEQYQWTLPSPARAGNITGRRPARWCPSLLPSPARAGNITRQRGQAGPRRRTSIPRSRGEHHQT